MEAGSERVFVVLFSGHTKVETFFAAAGASPSDFKVLVKPVQPQDLLAAIQG